VNVLLLYMVYHQLSYNSDYVSRTSLTEALNFNSLQIKVIDYIVNTDEKSWTKIQSRKLNKIEHESNTMLIVK